jgi:hypothetical protein
MMGTSGFRRFISAATASLRLQLFQGLSFLFTPSF